MNVSRDEAAKALDEIGRADVHMRRLRYFRASAPIFVMWGLVWVFANVLTDINDDWITWAWLPALPAVIISWWFGARLDKMDTGRLGPAERAAQPNFAVIAIGLWLSVVAIAVVAWPLDKRQLNALISLAVAGAYLISGAWLGWRMIVIGLVTMAATVFGAVMLKEHYFLWMGVAGGGALIVSGVWLRLV